MDDFLTNMENNVFAGQIKLVHCSFSRVVGFNWQLTFTHSTTHDCHHLGLGLPLPLRFQTQLSCFACAADVKGVFLRSGLYMTTSFHFA